MAREREVEKGEIEEETKIEAEEPVIEKVSEESETIQEESPRVYKRESKEEREHRMEEESLNAWKPKTELGRLVKSGKIKNIDEILDKKKTILEDQIVSLLISLKTDLISIGQSKGKFGGGKRRAWRQTQRKKKEGNVATFSTMAVVGDGNGHVGIGTGKAKETLPARAKAVRKAKLNLIKIRRGSGSFDSIGNDNNSIPFKVEGKSGSVRIILYPAPSGTGLVVSDQCKKILQLAGIKDVYSKTFGKTKTNFNLAKACIDALNKTNMEMQEQ
jgi:small subunit ribosomal protein S5